MGNIEEVDLTTKQKHFITSVINVHGSGQHPYCDENTFNYFRIDYVIMILNLKKVIHALSPIGLEMVEELNKILQNYCNKIKSVTYN